MAFIVKNRIRWLSHDATDGAQNRTRFGAPVWTISVVLL
jgi:hypothetical protein